MLSATETPMPERLPPEFLTTTSNVLDGYRVTRTFGVVRGITVRSRSVIGNIGVKFQQFFGGDITLLRSMCEDARADAFAIAIDHARSLGGNAIIAIRYDATEIMAGVSEVLCYGTAVRVVEDRNG
jgi:uncharacterized protein YbjQ (UPF0145 family)